jgi:hypothetical protein
VIVALLLGRKESKGFPGKNTFVICGHPMAYYPMIAAKECPDVSDVYISTDDKTLMSLAKENGVKVIARPPELCTDSALGEDAYVHGYNVIKELNPESEIEIVILLFCNAVAILPETISEGIRILRVNHEYDSAVTVSRYNMWSPLRARRIDENGLLQPFVPFEVFGDPKTLNCDRDSQGDAWFADMGVSIVKSRCLENIDKGLLPQKWMGQKIYPLKQWGGLDVDYEWQVPQVEFWLKEQNRVD